MDYRNKNRLNANPIDLMGLTDAMIEDDKAPEIVEVERIVEVIPANALVSLDDGSMQYGSYTLTVKGLMGGEQADEAEWENLGAVLRRLEGAIQWLIGDWFVQAERKWGKTYEQVSQKTGYAEKTLREYAYVARNVDLSIRMDKLSFGHHQLVAGKSPDEQYKWLAWAESQKASISQLRKALKPPAPPDEWGDEEQQMNVLSQYVNQNRAKIAGLKPEKRREYAEDAEKLAEYYARLAQWVRGLE